LQYNSLVGGFGRARRQPVADKGRQEFS